MLSSICFPPVLFGAPKPFFFFYHIQSILRQYGFMIREDFKFLNGVVFSIVAVEEVDNFG